MVCTCGDPKCPKNMIANIHFVHEDPFVEEPPPALAELSNPLTESQEPSNAENLTSETSSATHTQDFAAQPEIVITGPSQPMQTFPKYEEPAIASDPIETSPVSNAAFEAAGASPSSKVEVNIPVTGQNSSVKISVTHNEALHSAKRDRSETYPVLHRPGSRPWWKGVVAYQIWPTSFKDSGKDGVGDIMGIISKLDYLKDLGIDLIWLSPTYKSPLKDWGYDISDYEDIHSKFGTLEQMEQLIEEVHSRDMRIILDLVITHTSEEHKWFIESSSSKDNPKADWYMWADKRPGNMINGELVEEPSNWRAAFGGSAWEYVPEREQYYIHLFLKEQPDLNWHNPDMRKAVYESAVKFWLNRGVDGFRLDTANRFGKDLRYPDVEVTVAGKWQPGSKYYMNQPEMHGWLRELRQRIDADFPGQEIMIVGELPATPYNELLKYVDPESRELSMVFDFDMVKLGNNDNPDEYAKHEVCNYMDKDPSYTLPKFKTTVKKVQDLITDTEAWGTVFMENHDQGRSIPRYATSDGQYWCEAGKLLCLLQTTLSGTEFIYQGQEIGMLNMPEEWTKSAFRDKDALIYINEYVELHHKENPLAYNLAMDGIFKVGRDNSRTPMQWTGYEEPNAGFCLNKSWMPINTNSEWLNVAAQQQDPTSIWHFWKSQIQIRKDYKELFMFGTFALYDHENENTMTYTKMATDGTTALVILNFSDDKRQLNTIQRHQLGHEYHLMCSNYADSGEVLQPWEGRVYLVRKGLKADGKVNVGQFQDTHARI